MFEQAVPWLIGVGVFFIFVVGVLTMIARFYRKVDQGKALIVNTMSGEPKVTFTGMVVYPVLHRAEVMDISVKTIDIDRRGKDGLICRDNIRADIRVTFFVQVNKEPEDVLKVARLLGCVRASDITAIDHLFNAKFSEALKTVGKQFDFADLYTKRADFRKNIVEVIGDDLDGYTLNDAAIDYLEQTPLEHLDPENILDAHGIRKITEITAASKVETNELRQKERMEMGSQDLAADEAMFQFDQRRAAAEAKKQREISVANAREENEALRVRDQENKQTMLLRAKHEEEVLVADEAKQRGIAIAQKNREREIAVETERVEKARMIEEISRQRETELQLISKNKEVEVQKREIADVVRGRIVVDKTVAEEEERIKDLRLLAEAKRNKEATVINAEGLADEALLKTVKAAEANEQVSRLKAKEMLTVADAQLEAADKSARAKIREAEGAQATQAAAGLAQVRVKEANAIAIEKEGLAAVRVRDAAAAVAEKEGLASAVVVREKMSAEAVGREAQGLSEARVEEAHAQAIERTGVAEAAAIEKKLVAEATGLAEKANAMKALDGVGREHEEFRIRLEMEKEVKLKEIEVKQHIAASQASVMAEAMGAAKINIVGGDGEFFDRFMKAVTLGQSADGLVNNSETARAVLGEYLNGEKSLPSDVVEVLSNPAIDSEGIKNLSISALLAQMMSGADDGTKSKLQQLAMQASKLGLK